MKTRVLDFIKEYSLQLAQFLLMTKERILIAVSSLAIGVLMFFSFQIINGLDLLVQKMPRTQETSCPTLPSPSQSIEGLDSAASLQCREPWSSKKLPSYDSSSEITPPTVSKTINSNKTSKLSNYSAIQRTLAKRFVEVWLDGRMQSDSKVWLNRFNNIVFSDLLPFLEASRTGIPKTKIEKVGVPVSEPGSAVVPVKLVGSMTVTVEIIYDGNKWVVSNWVGKLGR